MRAQAADSHFMAQRILAALLVSGLGLFELDPCGRLMMRNVSNSLTWTVETDSVENGLSDSATTTATDWLVALCKDTFLRRAAYDAYLALLNPHEALVFLYRGLEWLKTGQNLRWEDIANDLGISEAELREFKKQANLETGIRHASRSGVKLRASAVTDATWACGLIDGINAARARLDPSFRPMSPEEVARAVSKAMPLVSYA